MDNLTAVLTALSDPTRRAILGRLARGTATVTELAAPFDMSQQAVSKHLAYLERARLISKRREGRLHFCSLDPKALDGVESWINDCRRLWEQRLDRLDLVLKDMKQEANRND